MTVFGFGSGLTTSALARNALYKQTRQYAPQHCFDKENETDAYLREPAVVIDEIRGYGVKSQECTRRRG